MLVAILYFFIIKRSIEQLPAILFIFLLLALGIQLSELIFFELLGLSYITQESNIFWICINTIMPIVFSFSISKLFFYLCQRYKLDFTLLESHDNLKLSSLMLSMIIFFFIIEIIRSNNSSIGRSNSLITNSTLLIITIICAIFIIFWFYRKSTLGKLHYEQIINNQLKEYLGSLEKLENTQRQFKHDFINIYGSLAGYIENNDMSGLKNYYYKEIEHINSEQNKKSFELKSLTNMKVIELKGLLSLKITKANALGVPINIEIVNPVRELFIDLFNLNRCIGILLDNALEEAAKENRPNKTVDVVIFSEKTKLTLLIKNSISKKMNIDAMFTKGYSTKGAKRGLGLPEVERIVDNTKNMSLETAIKNYDYYAKNNYIERRLTIDPCIYLLCEDNNKQREHIETLIKKNIMIENLDMHIAKSVGSPTEILQAVAVKENITLGIYFFDIGLNNPNLNRFTLAQEIRKLDNAGYIIFITTHAELAFQTFHYKIAALEYILKDNPLKIRHEVASCFETIKKQLSIDNTH